MLQLTSVELKDLKVPFKDSNKIKTNYSEVFQDIFILQCFDGEKEGTYLEIGAADPIIGNNTYLLEKDFGWDGLSIDYDFNEFTHVKHNEVIYPQEEFISVAKKEWFEERLQPLLLTNAVTCDWWDIIHGNLIAYCGAIDYLQVDIDPPENTYKCLKRLPFDKIDFKVITYEHDAYSDGGKCRSKSRKFLESKGYVLIAGNISNHNNDPFEDWWVNLKYINEMNPSIIRNIFEESLPVMEYMFNK